ncbi:hypothetical protein GCM10007979_18490 [Nocardioides albus]|nr:hypothetical protein GCM10007979_18490 [Nocardioides albus]
MLATGSSWVHVFQGEIDDAPDGFVDAILDPDTEIRHDSNLARRDYVERVVRGGFPEAVAREGRRRRSFHDAYVADLINRDVVQLSEIQHGREMRRLLNLVAARSGQLLQQANLAALLKASSTPRAEDFRGLRHLQERTGDDFLGGYLLHTGPRTISFGPKLRAVPISALWETAAPGDP